MPTIGVDKAALFHALDKEYISTQLTWSSLDADHCFLPRYTTEEFDELCFEFGEPPARIAHLVTTYKPRN